MLISFSLANFRSIRDRQTLSLEASVLKERFELLNENLLASAAGKPVVRAKVLYGANSSGKTNVLLGLFRLLELLNTKSVSADLSGMNPFLRADYLEKAPCEFELIVQDGLTTFRFGLSATEARIHREYLYLREGSGKEALAYDRTEKGVKFGAKYKKEWSPLPALLGTKDRQLLRADGLLLRQALNLDVAPANALQQVFGKMSVVFSRGTNDELKKHLLPQLKNKEVLGQLRSFLNSLDIEVEKLIYYDKDSVDGLGFSPNQQQEIIAKFAGPTILFVQQSFSKDGTRMKPIAWPIEHGESLGTQKIFWLAASIIASLRNGEVLVVDEFEASLHPRITEAIVEAFQQPHVNTGGGQLIIATHNTNLLEASLLRRDQIAFVEKDAVGGTELYALSDLTGIRNDRSYEKDYMVGKFGAVPAINFPLVTQSDAANE